MSKFCMKRLISVICLITLIFSRPVNLYAAEEKLPYNEKALDNVYELYKNNIDYLKILESKDGLAYMQLAEKYEDNKFKKWASIIASVIVGEKMWDKECSEFLMELITLNQMEIGEQMQNYDKYNSVKGLKEFADDVANAAFGFEDIVGDFAFSNNTVKKIYKIAKGTEFGVDKINEALERNQGEISYYQALVEMYGKNDQLLTAIVNNTSYGRLKRTAKKLIDVNDKYFAKELDVLYTAEIDAIEFSFWTLVDDVIGPTCDYLKDYAASSADKHCFESMGKLFTNWSAAKSTFKTCMLVGDYTFATSDNILCIEKIRLLYDIANDISAEIEKIEISDSDSPDKRYEKIMEQCRWYGWLLTVDARGENCVHSILTDKNNSLTILDDIINKLRGKETPDQWYQKQMDSILSLNNDYLAPIVNYDVYHYGDAEDIYKDYIKNFEFYGDERHPGYIKKLNPDDNDGRSYDYDYSEIPIKSLGYLIYDFDNDDEKELLIADVDDDYNIVLKMYEIEKNEVVLAATKEMSDYMYPFNLKLSSYLVYGDEEEGPHGIVDCYIFDNNGIHIAVEVGDQEGTFADGVLFDYAVFKYRDNSFNEVTSVSWEGSDFSYDYDPSMDYDVVESLNKVGIFTDSYESIVYHRNNTIEFVDSPIEFAFCDEFNMATFKDFNNWRDGESEKMEVTNYVFYPSDQLVDGLLTGNNNIPDRDEDSDQNDGEADGQNVYDAYMDFFASDEFTQYNTEGLEFRQYAIYDLDNNGIEELIMKEYNSYYEPMDGDGKSMYFTFNTDTNSVEQIPVKDQESNMLGIWYGPYLYGDIPQCIGFSSGEGHLHEYYKYDGKQLVFIREEYIDYEDNERVYVVKDMVTGEETKYTDEDSYSSSDNAEFDWYDIPW